MSEANILVDPISCQMKAMCQHDNTHYGRVAQQYVLLSRELLQSARNGCREAEYVMTGHPTLLYQCHVTKLYCLPCFFPKLRTTDRLNHLASRHFDTHRLPSCILSFGGDSPLVLYIGYNFAATQKSKSKGMLKTDRIFHGSDLIMFTSCHI